MCSNSPTINQSYHLCSLVKLMLNIKITRTCVLVITKTFLSTETKSLHINGTDLLLSKRNYCSVNAVVAVTLSVLALQVASQSKVALAFRSHTLVFVCQRSCSRSLMTCLWGRQCYSRQPSHLTPHSISSSPMSQWEIQTQSCNRPFLLGATRWTYEMSAKCHTRVTTLRLFIGCFPLMRIPGFYGSRFGFEEKKRRFLL